MTALRRLITTEFAARARPDELVGPIVDATWREVAPRNDLLMGRPRIKYVKRLAEVSAAARDLPALGEDILEREAEAAESGTDAPHQDLVSTAARLVDVYDRLRPALEGPAAVAATVVAEVVLAELDPLMAGAQPPVRHPGHPAGSPTGDLVAALRGWPGRWRYPRLTAALRNEDSPDVTGLLLAGLVDPLPPAESARELIEAGEYATADELREHAQLPAETVAQIVRNLRDAQAAARAQARYADISGMAGALRRHAGGHARAWRPERHPPAVGRQGCRRVR